MSRKQDEEDEKAEKEAAAAKRKASKEVTTGEPVVGATTTSGLPAEDYLTQQEKGGADPQNPAVEPVPAEVLDIPVKQPYPTGGEAA